MFLFVFHCSDGRIRRPRSPGCGIATFFFVLFLSVASNVAPCFAQTAKKETLLQSAVRSKRIQVNVVLGRLSIDGVVMGPVPIKRDGLKESLSVRSENSGTAVDYSLVSEEEELTVSAVKNGKVELTRIKKKPYAETIVYRQEGEGEVALHVENDKGKSVYSAPTLWHLTLRYPRETKLYFFPLLESLFSQLPIEKTALSVEKELLHRGSNGQIPDRPQWEKWVEQLGNDSYAKRQAADRSLRETDSAVLSYLQRLDFPKLKAEQQFRLRRIIDYLTSRVSEDSPAQIAAWLSGDYEVWMILLSRSEVETRRAAAGQLEAILKEKIPVDPDADPQTQKTSLERLRRHLQSAEGR